MKNIFRRTKDESSVKNGPLSFLPATHNLRDSIISFTLQVLQPYIDEKTIAVGGIHFYILCKNQEEEEAARVALCIDKPGMFKNTYLERALANHFISFQAGWFFEWHIVKDQLPEQAMQKGSFGLSIAGSHEPVAGQVVKACIEVLAGHAEQEEYLLNPEKQKKFYIGRTKMPQLSNGRIQQNDIVFLGSAACGADDLEGRGSLYVSRNHAYIIYDAATARYFLYPDKGGLPDNGNKLKVHTGDDKVKWLNIFGVPHCLCDGDQIELGGEAVLRFSMVLPATSLQRPRNSLI